MENIPFRASNSFQEMVLALQYYWLGKGCVLHQPYDLELGAGTFHVETAFAALGDKPCRNAYVQPSRRPQDGRYGDNPNRLQKYFQFQVLLKPSPLDIVDLFFGSLKAIGIDNEEHDIRLLEDNWESPTLGAWGLGWECWSNGLEVAQFTYFQQVAGYKCNPVSGELTYGLERLALFIQRKTSVFDLVYAFDQATGKKTTYGEIFQEQERQFSFYNFNVADIDLLFKQFEELEKTCLFILEQDLHSNKLVYPAYEQCLKASHIFNLLDARRAIAVADRQGYILRVRDLAKMCADSYLEYLQNSEAL